MKKTIKILIIVFSFLLVGIGNVSKIGAFADVKTSEIVMEVGSNRVLYSKNENEKMFMASTTKIVSAIAVIENMNMSGIITITKDTVGVEGSSIYLEEGEKLTVMDLLYGLMLRSGNDCAETLAVACSGSIDNFANLMNETAKKLGATNSNFTNPHGLHDDNHYTTAHDLALISSYAMKNDIFRKIVGTKRVEIPHSTRNHNRVLINKNKMLKEFEGANGIKTGFTKKAGRCLVSSCYRNGMELICVVLNCPPMFERSKALLSDAFNKYSNEILVNSDNIVGFIDSKSQKNVALCIKNDIILPLTKNEKKMINIVYDYPNQVNFELKNNQEVGNIKIYCENNLIFQEKIYTIL